MSQNTTPEAREKKEEFLRTNHQRVGGPGGDQAGTR